MASEAIEHPCRARATNEIRQALDQAEQGLRYATPDSCRTRDAMLYRAKTKEVVRPYRNLYVRPDYWSSLNARERYLHLMRTLQLRYPDWVFCGISAAVAHGLQVSYRDLSRVHVLCGTGGRHSDELVSWHKTPRSLSKTQARPCVAGSLRCTNFERTVIDTLRMLDFRSGLAVADSALRQQETDRHWLEGICLDYSGKRLRNMKQARLTASFADGRSENGGESYARAVMVELGFEVPELQAEFRDSLTGTTYRVDYLWILKDGTHVAGELDGRQKYADPAMTSGRSTVGVLADERLRESRLTAQTKVMRFSFSDAVHQERLERILQLYGIPRICHPGSLDVRAVRRSSAS